jgi:hypothetical protein
MHPLRADAFLPHVAPADRERLAAALLALRLEVLGDATQLGLALVLARGDRNAVGPWREWVGWLTPKLTAFEGVIDSSFRADAPQVGDSELMGALDELEATGQAQSLPDGDEARGHWAQMLERLALRGRELEELRAEPMGEEEGREFGAGVALLGALTDGLVLAVFDESGSGEDAQVTAGELLDGLLGARKEGAWDFLDAA